jgi:hypothetical protein
MTLYQKFGWEVGVEEYLDDVKIVLDVAEIREGRCTIFKSL